jgi:hypothetical protein
VRRLALHAADRGHTVRQIKEEHGVDQAGRHVGIGRVREVTVHLGEAGHQVFAAPRDADRVGRDANAAGRTDRRDPPVPHHDRLVLEHPARVHWEHAHVHERNGGGRRLEQERDQ